MLDHVVLAVPDLADGLAGFQRLTGVRPVMGGSHINLGTANLSAWAVGRTSKSPVRTLISPTRLSHARSAWTV
jgi:hypothetical protein